MGFFSLRALWLLCLSVLWVSSVESAWGMPMGVLQEELPEGTKADGGNIPTLSTQSEQKEEKELGNGEDGEGGGGKFGTHQQWRARKLEGQKDAIILDGGGEVEEEGIDDGSERVPMDVPKERQKPDWTEIDQRGPSASDDAFLEVDYSDEAPMETKGDGNKTSELPKQEEMQDGKAEPPEGMKESESEQTKRQEATTDGFGNSNGLVRILGRKIKHSTDVAQQMANTSSTSFLSDQQQLNFTLSSLPEGKTPSSAGVTGKLYSGIRLEGGKEVPEGKKEEEELDPFVDDIDALNNGTTEAEKDEDNEKSITLSPAEQQLRARQCSQQLSPFVSPMLLQSPPFRAWDLGCYYAGKEGKSDRQQKTDQHKSEQAKKADQFWNSVWEGGKLCHRARDLLPPVTSRPHCNLIIGFIDHLHSFHDRTLISELYGEKVEGKSAVVRLVCNKQMEQFREALKQKELERQKELAEETFLKTVVVVEFTWQPDCTVVYFDSRTLDWSDRMGQLLFGEEEDDGDNGNGGGLKLGTRDGKNMWAASKTICGDAERAEFSKELALMRSKNAKLDKKLRSVDTKIRDVLRTKMDEEMFSTYQVTAPPADGFFHRLWEGVFG